MYRAAQNAEDTYPPGNGFRWADPEVIFFFVFAKSTVPFMEVMLMEIKKILSGGAACIPICRPAR